VLELSRTLAYEWGPRVRVNCVAPGPVVTPGFEGAYHPKILKEIRDLPLARPGTAQEVANGVVFLASPAASYVTGEVLFVAGGQQNYGMNQALFRESFTERTAEPEDPR
jgi:NAD(P)-dependent dehydrogenase (short-subunit alcohol dehydrogenase family)